MPTDTEVKQAKEEGRKAFWDGKDESKNPYDPADDRFLSWNDGYNEAVDAAEGMDDPDEGACSI